MKSISNQKISLSNIVFFVIFFLICGVGCYFQLISSMNIDASNALHEAAMALSGKKYFYDFYETTPPMFLYLYFPLVFFIKHFDSINFMFFYISYYWILLSISLLFSAYSLTKLHLKKTHIQILLIFLSLILWLQPAFYFGQREYTALLLTLPYFFLIALRYESIIVKKKISIFIAIFSACGFCIEPHFAFAFLLSEIVFFIRKKSFLLSLRIESIVIICFFILYLISTALFYPAYFTRIIPQTLQFYYIGIKEPFMTLFFQKNFLYAMICCLFYFILPKKDKYHATAFLVAIIGFAISYLAQGVPWKYHMFTAYAYGIFFSIYCLLARLFSRPSFSLSNKNFLFYLASGTTILFFPITTTARFIEGAVFTKTIDTPIVYFLHTYAYQKPVYFIESVLNDEYPTVDYAGSKHCARFPYMIWMPAYLRSRAFDPNSSQTKNLDKINHYFTSLMAKDIAKKKPLYVFVDDSEEKSTPIFSVSHLNYLQLLNQTAEFKEVWKKYRYVETINNEPFYRLSVYTRKRKP